jgi:hypothetical protein
MAIGLRLSMNDVLKWRIGEDETYIWLCTIRMVTGGQDITIVQHIFLALTCRELEMETIYEFYDQYTLAS